MCKMHTCLQTRTHICMLIVLKKRLDIMEAPEVVFSSVEMHMCTHTHTHIQDYGSEKATRHHGGSRGCVQRCRDADTWRHGLPVALLHVKPRVQAQISVVRSIYFEEQA
jgi:hypothetical protein